MKIKNDFGSKFFFFLNYERKLFIMEDVFPVGTRSAQLTYEPSIKYEHFKSNEDKKTKSLDK